MTIVKDDALFDLQLIIDPVIRDQSALLRHLEGRGLFEIDAPINGLYLPIDQAFATKLGCSRYSSDPLPSYREGMLQELLKIELSPDGQSTMHGGDASATPRVVEAVWQLQATIKVALTNGDLILA
ncbi:MULTISPECIES: hypothetical protein [Xanthomonas]|uniref:hypothetical protein n=1 Tax=Xanthomonas TaxID=338 RepID=UPI001F19F7CE|nr:MULTISPECIES: hypothetical protein [Xanthomonas]